LLIWGWGQDDWRPGVINFRGLFPSADEAEDNLFDGGNHESFVSAFARDAGEAKDLTVGWPYPVELSLDVSRISCEGHPRCDAHLSTIAGNDAIVDALESGIAPEPGLIGRVGTVGIPAHYNG